MIGRHFKNIFSIHLWKRGGAKNSVLVQKSKIFQTSSLNNRKERKIIGNTFGPFRYPSLQFRELHSYHESLSCCFSDRKYRVRVIMSTLTM
jgi:hypothetical protein